MTLQQHLRQIVGHMNLLRRDWRRNYAYHGGISAALRCLAGSVKVARHTSVTEANHHQLDCLTFTVVPCLGVLWSALIPDHVLSYPTRVLIGDCCGGFLRKEATWRSNTIIIPFLNYTHGQKLDIFIQNLCDAEYVLVSDDDVFFLDGLPLHFAIETLQRNPRVAVVSLVPRFRFTWEIDGKEHQPMGSYCLVIRRELWLKEGLSFRTVHKPSINPKSYKGEYDTADFANVELIKRGYEVIVAPDSIREHMIVLKGVSRTMMEIQAHPDPKELLQAFREGEPLAETFLEGVPLAERNLATALFYVLLIRMIKKIIADRYKNMISGHFATSLAPENVLDVAEQALSQELESGIATEISERVEAVVSRLKEALNVR